MTQKIFSYDLVIAGGGLAAYLTAAIVLKKCPTIKIAIVERDQTKSHHTWSFHAKDLSKEALELLTPLISQTWQDYTVKFPDHERKIELGYCSIRSEDFWKNIDKLTNTVTKITGAVRDVGKTEVVLADQRTFKGRIVLDARGVNQTEFLESAGWQKFIGFEIETEKEHGISRPTIMDATVEQTDGYRFFYVLPFSANKVLIEDTYYSDNKSLNVSAIEKEIERYIKNLGITSYKITSKESGVLPIPLNHSYLLSDGNLREIGMRGGFFHPTSGYSLPFCSS